MGKRNVVRWTEAKLDVKEANQLLSTAALRAESRARRIRETCDRWRREGTFYDATNATQFYKTWLKADVDHRLAYCRSRATRLTDRFFWNLKINTSRS